MIEFQVDQKLKPGKIPALNSFFNPISLARSDAEKVMMQLIL